MVRSLIRTIRGPSRDPRMDFISRPLPKGLRDEDVVSALEGALAANANPAYLVETLPDALREVTGRDYQVLDRSVWDVTGAFGKTKVMIRDGGVGLWPGYAARAYPLLATPEHREVARREIAAAAGAEEDRPSPTNPVGKPGWAPPPPITGVAPEPVPDTSVPVGDADAGASLVQVTPPAADATPEPG
ncbi:MAG TPA: hypothetical protein VFY43_07085 [Candidatus Limnocylindria bacterium]|nr:hypothetical protein [Candidatus Limnocylindria bacterium]